jgi:hypothetical protein
MPVIFSGGSQPPVPRRVALAVLAIAMTVAAEIVVGKLPIDMIMRAHYP